MSEMTKPVKPLGRKAYGSIGHIHGSRLGPGDHHVHEGQSHICTTAAQGRTVWVQTKLDGSCVSAAKLDGGTIVALGRAGYEARTSQYEMHHLWADFVDNHRSDFDALLDPGERVVGEWLAQAHGTTYELSTRSPFVAFDIMRGGDRLFTQRVYERCKLKGFANPDIISGPCDPLEALASLDHYGADEAEGVVYRVESTKKGGLPKVEFLAKWVRPGKVDGAYLDGPPVWNWLP